MSTQLILYPQNYNGVYTFTSVLNQYVAGANFITGIASNTATSATQPANYAVANSAPISAWKSFNSTGGTFANVSAPSISTSGLTLASNGSSTSSSGAYQLISNLSVGNCYEIKVTISTASTSGGYLYVGAGLSTWLAAGTTYYQIFPSFSLNTSSVSTMSSTFYAQHSEEVLLLDYRHDNGSSVVISEISITECTPVLSDLTDGQVICDLYEEEAIPLSLSIDDFKNVAEKTQSYSKDFHLPNTKRNNKIFGHIFEVTRSTDTFSFNPYIKTRAILKEDSYTLFEGFLKLIDINDKEGEISYNVNMYSEAVTLKDILDTKTFADINFIELQHDYTITNVQNSWDDTTGLELENAITTSSYAYDSGITSPTDHTNVLKYPFVNWRGDWTLDASNNIELDDLEQVFRPWIQVKYLVDRIISEAEFEYTSTFLNTTNFKKLFMDFNWGQGLGSSEVTDSFSTKNDHHPTLSPHPIVWAGTSWTELELGEPHIQNPTGVASTYFSGNRITAVTTNTSTQINYSFTVYNHYSATSTGSAQTVEFKWEHFDAGGASLGIYNQSNVITIGTHATYAQKENFYDWFIVPNMNTGDYLTAYFRAGNINSVFQGNQYGYAFPDIGTWTTSRSFLHAQITSIQTSASSLLHAIRGETNQWEFLKGIFTMFNLVVVSEDEVLRIEPYADIFITGSAVTPTTHNWTEKVDISDINLKPLELKKKVKFTYEDDDDDYALNVYKKATSGYLYGTKKFPLSGTPPEKFTLLTGEEEIVATPFAPTLIRPATDLFDITLTIPHIYSGNDDGTEFEDFENAPRILYNIGIKTLSTNNYVVPIQNGGVETTLTEFLQFAHISEILTTATTIDYNFGECQLISVGATPIDNLYNTYYSPYYDELYHSDTRVMTLKVNLSPAQIQNFKFYDVVVIKNREYRVNKIEYKPNTLAKVEFILIP